MYNNIPFALIIALLIIKKGYANDYSVTITTDTPVVIGATVHFQADLYEGNERPSGTFKFIWRDDSIPSHHKEVKTERPVDLWNVTYPAANHPPGRYIVEVEVQKCNFFLCYFISSQRVEFHLTDTLNGEMDLIQNDVTLKHEYVSNKENTLHQIRLKQSDFEFLNSSSTSVLTYWFLDCQYMGPSDDYSLTIKYNNSEEVHDVEALVVANFDPITTTTTTTTPSTTTSTTSTTKPTTTVKPVPTTKSTPITKSTSTTTTTASTTKTTPSSGTSLLKKTTFHDSEFEQNEHQPVVNNINRNKRSELTDNLNVMVKVKGLMLPINKTLSYNGSYPFKCGNNTVLPLGINNTFGYFSRKVIAKSPVSNVKVSGNNWLEHGDMLSLSVSCEGSSTFTYCVHFKNGVYNITGNETCNNPYFSEKCEFLVNRYYNDDKAHTVVLIISNDVNKVITRVAIQVYTVKKQAQLSVIVVPVVSSLVAIVLVIFGIAYYIQNRNRFIVEVADFNFGQTYNDLEYKTFRERLRDSIYHAFSRGPTPSSSDNPIWQPGPNKKYGSMTT